jgi:isoquinoline 1-oxidoreductase
VIVPDTGGGFGGKHTGDAAIEAARLAKASGKPVSLRWTRDEEFTWAYFRPAGLIEIAAALDGEGRISGWDYTNYNSGTSALATPYAIANRKEQFRYCDSPLREGSYRALAWTANNFARECFMDELASAAGKDPLTFRLAHLEHPRLRFVLESAASRFKWSDRKGRAVGLACGTEKGSFVAACAEVEVKDGKIRVLEICQAFDCGAVMNPANLKAQVEGCIIMTLGAALAEEIRFENGRILNGRFSQYRVPRFRGVPKLDLVLLNRPDLEWAGAGETPMIAAPPAVANAVFQATGTRLRSMPLRLA